MELSNELLILIVTSIFGGIGFLAKYILNKRDENQKRIFEQRDADKAEMKNDITELKSEVKSINNRLKRTYAIILNCDNPECPAKKELAKDFEKEQ